MRHCCPQMTLPWEAGARQAVVINDTICVFVLKKKKAESFLATPLAELNCPYRWMGSV